MEKKREAPTFMERFWTPIIVILTAYRFFINRDLYPSAGFDFSRFVSGPFYQAGVVAALGALLSPSLRKTNKGMFWRTLDIGLGTFLIAQISKFLFRMPRPSGSLHGFPSGHTMFSFALAFLLFMLNPKLAVFWFGIAALVGWSRVETNAHYPYQVYFGAIFGLLLGYAASSKPEGFLLRRFFPDKRVEG